MVNQNQSQTKNKLKRMNLDLISILTATPFCNYSNSYIFYLHQVFFLDGFQGCMSSGALRQIQALTYGNSNEKL